MATKKTSAENKFWFTFTSNNNGVAPLTYKSHKDKDSAIDEATSLLKNYPTGIFIAEAVQKVKPETPAHVIVDLVDAS